MESLELRRLHSDLIFTYKILFGLTKINPADFFTFPSSTHNTRGHSHKLVLNNSRVNVRQHFFGDRVIKPWNSLKVTPSSFNSILSFKSCLQNNDFNQFLKLQQQAYNIIFLFSKCILTAALRCLSEPKGLGILFIQFYSVSFILYCVYHWLVVE